MSDQLLSRPAQSIATLLPLPLVVLFDHECRIKIARNVISNLSAGVVPGPTEIHNGFFQRYIETTPLCSGEPRHTEQKQKSGDLAKRTHFS
jgi:hypothetical protein